MTIIYIIGEFLLSTLFFVVLIIISRGIAKALKLPARKKGCDNMRKYSESVAMFTLFAFASMVTLLGIAEAFPEKDVVISGLFFAIGTLAAGIITRILYWIFMKLRELYKMDIEIKWTFIVLCITLSISCFHSNSVMYGCIFMAFACGKLFWFDFNKNTLINELASLKQLPRTYFYSLAVIADCIFVSSRYSEETINWYLGVAGMLIGALLIILYDIRTEKKKACGDS